MDQNPSKKHVGAAVGLFFLAPLVAEFLLGNLPIKLLPALVVLAPMYGGGALLIRETVRRMGRGWPSILLLALAFGILEEAFATQSLFNPDYLGMHMGLLKAAYIPALKMGGWWTIFVRICTWCGASRRRLRWWRGWFRRGRRRHGWGAWG